MSEIDPRRYSLNVEWIATGPGWLAEVSMNGRVLEGRWFESEHDARSWFREEYGCCEAHRAARITAERDAERAFGRDGRH